MDIAFARDEKDAMRDWLMRCKYECFWSEIDANLWSLTQGEWRHVTVYYTFNVQRLRRVLLAMSTSSKPHLTTEEIGKTRAKFQQFRILVIGRANAGKTTILRKVCNTTGDPTIFDPEGNKVNDMMKVQTFMSDNDILVCDLRSSRPSLIHPGR